MIIVKMTVEKEIYCKDKEGSARINPLMLKPELLLCSLYKETISILVHARMAGYNVTG